jgi:hypothetical protein
MQILEIPDFKFLRNNFIKLDLPYPDSAKKKFFFFKNIFFVANRIQSNL